jgi:hypothetical protein
MTPGVNARNARTVAATMIIFDLSCSHAHRFEGWFASSEDYARQREAGSVRCPVCDDAWIDRVPSARVSVPRHATPVADSPPAPAETATPERTQTPAETAVAGLPAEVLAVLREVVRSTENVGTRFPEEARRIHYAEVPARAIRGQASKEEAAELRDEGIEFASLPEFLVADSH